MKYLINRNFKAIRRGNFVTASADAGEFILDTEDQQNCPNLGVLIEIDKANKLEIIAKHKKNKLDFLQQAHEKLKEVSMSEQNEEALNDKASKLIEESHENGKSKEDMIVSLIQMGMKLGPASKLIKSKLINLGAIVTPKDRKQKGFVILEDMNFKPENFEDVMSAAAKIQNNVPKTDTGKAMSVIRQFSKEKGIELPKKVKGATNIRLKVFDYMITNPAATKAEFTAHLESLSRKEKFIERAWETFEVAKKMAETLSTQKAA